MKNVRFWLLLGCLIPCCAFGAGGSDFQQASQLLAAARRGDTKTIQFLVNSGVDVNYVDSTGLSLVCTAVMNNDKRAIQILQMYGADASNCDKQIKQYKQKTKMAASGEEYGFFSGLSSSHIVALSAVGVAAVIGGVLLLTDAFDSENNNNQSSSGGRGDSDNGSPSGSSATALFSTNLPYGPLCVKGTCPTDFSVWDTNNVDFSYMSSNNRFNYLMVSRAYDAFVRGYLGMNTVRSDTTNEIFDLTKYDFDQLVDGGKPVNVAMVTGSGVNATGSATDKDIYWFDKSKRNAVITACKNGDTAACKAAANGAVEMSHKYGNLSSGNGGTVTESKAFDLSNSGSVFGLATDSDTKLAKIIAGWESEDRDSNGDYYGFLPNGQITVYKTGNGQYWGAPGSSYEATGIYDFNPTDLAVDGTFEVLDEVLTITSVDGNSFVAKNNNESKEYHGYIVNGLLFIDANADGNINLAYEIGDSNDLTLVKELRVADYKNYAAISDAVTRQVSGSYFSNVIANLSLPVTSGDLDYMDVSGAKALYDSAPSAAAKKSVFMNPGTGQFDTVYNLNTSDASNVNTPAQDANIAFVNLGNIQKQILVNPAGHYKYGIGNGASLSPQWATFENFVPVIYPDLEHLFMTVVAVQPSDGTSGTIDDYNEAWDSDEDQGSGKFMVSQWADSNDANTVYSSRMCGLTGTGNSGTIDPWCFAAPGTTDLEATAAMAGGVALVRSAFDYMDAKEVFLLLALTADGPYLGRNPLNNGAWETSDLITYLKNRYDLPAGFDTSDAAYLDSFKNAFGYGMINIERATRPGTNVYFYDGTNNIITTNTKPYWGTALNSNASRESSQRASSVLSLAGRGEVTTSFYDIVESFDGSISLPRIWKTTIALNDSDKHGLYMGDVLGDFNVDSTNKHSNQIGNLKIDMAMSARAYNDNLNGLDDMRVAWTNDTFDLVTEYQHYLTDGESRFNGRANGVLGLVSNTLSANTMYKNGRFGFGGRAFVGAITDENLLDKDPVVAAQYEPGRLGLANGGSFDARYAGDRFDLNLSAGVMHENNTVLGMFSEGILAMNNADTKYMDASATYKLFDNVKLSMRGTFATTHINNQSEFIAQLSDIKSNAFAFGTDIGGFSFTFALPLAVTDGRLGYGDADFKVVENNGKYEIAMNNPHMEYIDLSAQKRELRFSTSYKHALGEWTDAGVGLIYRMNPNNTDAFGNESILMFKMHHRLGI